MSPVVVVVAVVVLTRSRFVAVVSALADFAVVFASTLAALVGRVEVVFGAPVALAVVVFGPFVVCEPTFLGPEAFGPACVVFGDETFGEVPLDETCCGFGVDPLLPCARTVADEASVNATAETSAIIVRVMNPPKGHSPGRLMDCKRHSSAV